MASYTEDQLVTTNPEQLLEIERAKKEFEESFGGEDIASKGAGELK